MRGWNSQFSSTWLLLHSVIVFDAMLMVVFAVPLIFSKIYYNIFLLLSPSDNCQATTIIFSFCGEIKLFFIVTHILTSLSRVQRIFLCMVPAQINRNEMKEKNLNACDWMINTRTQVSFSIYHLHLLHIFVWINLHIVLGVACVRLWTCIWPSVWFISRFSFGHCCPDITNIKYQNNSIVFTIAGRKTQWAKPNEFSLDTQS